MPSKTGIGASLVFSGGISYSGFRVMSIGPIGRAVDDLDDTALDSAGFYELCPDDLERIDPIDVQIYLDATKQPPVASVGTITITLPTQDGQSTAAIVTGTGYIKRREIGELAAGVRLMETVTVQFDGKTGPTYTPAS